MRRIVLSVLALGVLGPVAAAGPLKVAQVSAGAKWAAHLDVEALLQSDVGKLLLEEAEKHNKFLDGIAQVRKVFGFDPLRDIRGLTAYGTRYGDESGVIVADATADQNKVIGVLMTNETYREHEYAKRTLHQWTDKPKPGKDGTIPPGPGKTQFGCFYDANTVLIASSLDLLKDEIDVLDGKADSLAKTNGLALLPKPLPGAFLVGAGEQIELPADGDKPQAAVTRDLTDLAVQVGETDGVLFVNATAVTKTPKRALQLRQIVQGFIALGQLTIQERKDIPVLGETIEVTGNDNVARLSASAPTQSVVKVLKYLAAEAERKKAARAGVPGE